MRLYIPQLGDKLELSKDWTFDLHPEPRNNSLFKQFSDRSWLSDYTEFRKTGKEITPMKVTLPKGTVLNVDRIYIRKGASNFDSITFKIEDSENKDLIKCRFWVKLKDANFEFEENKTIKRMPSLTWTGWLPDKTKSVKPNHEINREFMYNPLHLRIDNILRFTIELKPDIVTANEMNWKLYNFDKIYKLETFEDYHKHTQTRFRRFIDGPTTDYRLVIPRYILTDILKDEKYIYFTKNACKETARKILKKEFKNKT